MLANQHYIQYILMEESSKTIAHPVDGEAKPTTDVIKLTWSFSKQWRGCVMFRKNNINWAC